MDTAMPLFASTMAIFISTPNWVCVYRCLIDGGMCGTNTNVLVFHIITVLALTAFNFDKTRHYKLTIKIKTLFQIVKHASIKCKAIETLRFPNHCINNCTVRLKRHV